MNRLFIVCCVSLTFLSRAALGGGSGAAQLPADVTINHGAGRGDFLMVTLRLETGEHVPFVVDTGSPCTLIDKSFESKLGKRVGMFRFGTVRRGFQDCGRYDSPKLFLGDVPLVTGTNIVAYDFGEPRGTLGMDCLRNYCIQLDFQAKKMRFLQSGQLNPAELGRSIPMFLQGIGSQKLFVYPWIHQPGLFSDNTNLLVDTGCRIDGLAPQAETRALAWHSFLGLFGAGRLHSGTWDGEEYKNIKLAPVHDVSALGLRFLARHLVTLDFPGHTLYLKQTNVGPLPGRYRKFSSNPLNEPKGAQKLMSR